MSFIQGLPAPIGTSFYDNGTLKKGARRYLVDGTQVLKSSALGIATYQAYKLLYGKYCTFNASAAPIVIMTGDTTPANYSCASNMVIDAAYPIYKMFDNNAATLCATVVAGTYTYGYFELAHPATTIFGYALRADSASGAMAYMPTVGKVTESVDGTNHIDNGFYEGFQSWTAGQERAIPLVAPIVSVKTRLWVFGTLITNKVVIADFRIFGADLSTIKCLNHNKPTGTAINFAPKSGGILPTGISENTTYYLRAVDANNITLHPTLTDAINNTNAITITSAGSGEFYMDDDGKVTLPNTASTYIAY